MRPPLRRGAIDVHLCDAAFAGAASACAKARGCCAGIVRKRFSCVARRTDMPRTFLAWCSFAPMHSTRICAALLIVAFTFYGGRKRQENYTAKRLLPCSSCFASACLLGAIPARRDTQKERMPGSPSEWCTGRRPARYPPEWLPTRSRARRRACFDRTSQKHPLSSLYMSSKL